MLQDQFSELLAGNKDGIFRICSAYTTSRADAEDVFQEVLLNIWKALPGFRGEANISTWAYRITLNVCIQTKYRKDKRPLTIALDGLRFEPPAEDKTTNNYNALYECIHALGDAEKALMLLFLEDLSYREIGLSLGLSENHVAVKIKRTKTKLFTCLKSKGYDR